MEANGFSADRVAGSNLFVPDEAWSGIRVVLSGAAIGSISN